MSHVVRIVPASPWQEAVIAILEPRSPYRPWPEHHDAEPGDNVVVVLDTDPMSVVAGVGVVGADGGVHQAITDHLRPSGLLELATVNALTDCFIDPRRVSTADGELADTIVATLSAYCLLGDAARFGHTSLAAARILLNSNGWCTACEQWLPLTAPDAIDLVHIHTAVPFPITVTSPEPWPLRAADWPGVLCNPCHRAMSAHGFTSLVDFMFFSRPDCPECGAQRARSAIFGMPLGRIEEPWKAMMGCCVTEPRPLWECGACRHTWA